jgi:glutamate-1-semialdehyde 2,1-aminomutase
MSPALIVPTSEKETADTIKLPDKSSLANTTQALEAAKARFVERNKTSLKLHEESVKSLPGGNTRSLLHTAPFPVFVKSGKEYQITSEDGHA